MEMKHYYAELEEMLAETKAAKTCLEISSVTAMTVKRIYRSLAKKLHPDIRPEVTDHPELMDLWNRIMIAYQNNNLKELKELEVLAATALEQLGDQMDIDIPDLEQKIHLLEMEIASLLSREPYTYKNILEREYSTWRNKLWKKCRGF